MSSSPNTPRAQSSATFSWEREVHRMQHLLVSKEMEIMRLNKILQSNEENNTNLKDQVLISKAVILDLANIKRNFEGMKESKLKSELRNFFTKYSRTLGNAYMSQSNQSSSVPMSPTNQNTIPKSSDSPVLLAQSSTMMSKSTPVLPTSATGSSSSSSNAIFDVNSFSLTNQQKSSSTTSIPAPSLPPKPQPPQQQQQQQRQQQRLSQTPSINIVETGSNNNSPLWLPQPPQSSRQRSHTISSTRDAIRSSSLSPSPSPAISTATITTAPIQQQQQQQQQSHVEPFNPFLDETMLPRMRRSSVSSSTGSTGSLSSYSNSPLLSRSTSHSYIDHIIFIQRLWKQKLQDRKKLRDLKSCNQEIIDTQRTFVSKMTLCIEIIMKPLRNAMIQHQVEITQKEFQLIFGNMEEILAVSKQLLFELEQRISQFPEKWIHIMIGRIFKSSVQLLRLPFVKYSANCKFAMESLAVASKKYQNLSKWLKNVYLSPQLDQYRLEDFLIFPVKRFLLYSLLIGAVIKRLPNNTKPYKLLCDAKKSMEEIASGMEDPKLAEHMGVILGIQGKINGDFPNVVVAGRTFVREGTMIYIKERTPITYYFYLFSDILIYTTPLNYNFNGMISLERGVIDSLSNADSRPSIDNVGSPSVSGSGFKNAFILITPTKSYKLLCSSRLDKDNWIRDISNCISQLKEKNRHIEEYINEFVMFPDSLRNSSSRKISTIKEGFLFKMGGLMKQWSKRWYILEDGILYYYKSNNYGATDVPKAIVLKNFFMQEIDSRQTGRDHCFQLYNHDIRDYVICAPNSQSKFEWMSAIRPFTLFGNKPRTGPLLSPKDLISFEADPITGSPKLRASNEAPF